MREVLGADGFSGKANGEDNPLGLGGSVIQGAFLPLLERTIRGLFYLYCFALPFKDLLVVERLGIIVLIILVILWSIWTRLEGAAVPGRILFPIVAFVVWVAITVPWAAMPMYSLGELGKFLRNVFVMWIVWMFFRDEQELKRLVFVMMGALLVISIGGIVEFILAPAGSGLPAITNYRIGSFVGGNMWMISYLVMLIPLAACLALFSPSSPQRTLYGLITALGLGCVVLSFSAAGILSVIAQTLTAGWVLKRRMVMMVAGVGALCLVVGVMVYSSSLGQRIASGNSSLDPTMVGEYRWRGGTLQEYNLRARLNVWAFGLGKIQEHPLSGVGFGSETFDLVYGREAEQLHDVVKHPMPKGTHNTFLSLALGIGLPGLMLFLWLLGVLFREAVVGYKKASTPLARGVALAGVTIVVGMVVRNLFDHMLVGHIAILFWVSVGVFSAAMAWAPNLPPSSQTGRLEQVGQA